jgi:hypothetical protein
MLTAFIHTKSVVDGPLDAQVIPCPSLICFNNGIHAGIGKYLQPPSVFGIQNLRLVTPYSKNALVGIWVFSPIRLRFR